MSRKKRVRAYGVGRVFRPMYTYDGRPRESSVWWIAYVKDGKEVRESSKSRDRSEAEELLRTRLSDIHHGRNSGPVVDKTTFDDLKQMILDDYALNNQDTRVLTVCRLPPLKKAFGHMLAKDIDEAAILKYSASRKKQHTLAGGKFKVKSAKTYSNGTINRELSVLKRMLRLAYEQRRLARVPLVKMLSENNARKGFFDYSDVTAAQEHLPDPSLKRLLEVAFITGWRMESELLERKWSDVDFDAGELRLYMGEAKDRTSGRVFPMVQRLREILKEQQVHVKELERTTGKDIQWVFVRSGKRSQGEKITSCRKAMKAAFKAAGRPGVPHDLRRSAVRSLERSQVPRSVAKQMVGHKTDAMYNRYSIVDQQMMEIGRDKLSTFLESERPSS